ncbi:HMHA1 protein, partial [Amia calva]|nr:HMHA1 protein [Amia calva]
MEEMTIWEQYTITLNKDPKVGFGLAIAGGRDKPSSSGDTSVVISDVVRNGPAAGRLHTKDRIVMVNGISMDNVTSNFTIQHLKSCGKTANITVKRPRNIQLPVTTAKPLASRSASRNNVVEDFPSEPRTRLYSDSGSDRSYGRTKGRKEAAVRSSTPDRNGHALPLMSGFKRLPNQDTMNRPIRATLLKKKASEEYGLKLGSQIFVKHMTPTGLAAKEGTLQEGDLILKINGMTTENLSLLDTKHLVERSEGRLSMVVLRDDRQFLVNIPDIEDSEPESDDQSRGDSSELEDISDLDSHPRPTKKKQRSSERKTRSVIKRCMQQGPKSVYGFLLQLFCSEASDSESEPSRTPLPRRDIPDNRAPRSKYRVLPEASLPNPRASPLANALDSPRWGTASRPPWKEVSESDSDRSPSPPVRQDTPNVRGNLDRYRVPEPTQLNLPASPLSLQQDSYRRGPSLVKPAPQDPSDSESDPGSSNPSKWDTSETTKYAILPEVSQPRSHGPPPTVEPPRWVQPLVVPLEQDSQSDDSPLPSPRQDTLESRDRYRAPPDVRAPSVSRSNDSTRYGLSPARPTIEARREEEPIYSVPPDSPLKRRAGSGYSSDQRTVEFMKENSIGLRLVGGNDVGIFVAGVQPNSQAHQQGMKEGDQILQNMNPNVMSKTKLGFLKICFRLETQNKMDIYRKVLQSNLGDSFYIRTHFDQEAEGPSGLSFTRGEVFRVVDTMHCGKLGTWLAVRMGNDLHELDKGTIPNLSRAEAIASLEQAQRSSGGSSQVSGPRAEFWKLRGLRGAKKNLRRSRDDLLQLTIQGKYPAYEKILLREATFKRPIVILGPLNDVAMEKLARIKPDEFQMAEMVPRSGTEGSSSVIKLESVKRISEQNKHPLLDITPTAVERLNYIQYHPLVLFLDPHSRKDVKAMRKRLCPDSNKSSRRLYAQALKIKKYCAHLFCARIDLKPGSDMWFDIVQDTIRNLQSKPVWVSEVTLEGGEAEEEERELDALGRTYSSDYLSCTSRAASDYESTDGEGFTDEELDEPPGEAGGRTPYMGVSLARSSEPALERDSSASDRASNGPRELPPILHVPEPQSRLRSPGLADPHVPSPVSFSDDFSQYSDSEPPDFRAPNPPSPVTTLDPPPPPPAVQEELSEPRRAEPQENKPSQQKLIVVSELLMGEVDSSTLLSLPPKEKSRSMENLYGGVPGQGSDMTLMKSEFMEFAVRAEEVDIILQRSEGGVDSALAYAKNISKYLKDVIGYVDKRIALEMEFAKGLQRLYQSFKQSIAQPHMPFFSIYSLALEQDVEQSHGVLQTIGTLHNQTFMQPLLHRKQEHEKKRKEIKEQWHRAQRKLMEAVSNLRKAKQAYMVRCEEYDKARTVATKAGEEQQGGGSNTTKSLDKKRRLEEEARNKAEEAEATYRVCIADAKTQNQELEDVKVNVLRQIQEVIKQSDHTLRSATISYYQMMHMQTAALPVHYQTLCESSKLYDPGQQYGAYVKNLHTVDEQEIHYDFEPYEPASISLIPARARNDSFNTDTQSTTATEAPSATEETAVVEGSTSLKDKQRRGVRSHQSHKSWPSTVSDTDSVGGGSGLESPSISTGDVRKLPRTSSTGTMSSNEELDEKDGNVATFEQSMNGIEPEIAVPTGPFRNVGLSKAALTHRLRKLRTPSKCRECDSYVYFQGAECEECFLACHKKCLETLAIQCGHKKLQGRLQLFGRDFSQSSHGNAEGIPFIIKKCISEIEKRALKMKGIYRVNGVKTRVEKLCQAFENGKELVELSQASPHDISNVLKLYLRQLPEPIMPFRLYNDLMGLAKESLQAGEGGEPGKGPELVDLGPDTDKDVLTSVVRLQEVLKELPPPNVATLRYIIKHLRRISEFEQDNKMSSSNLGIVFGPTLMRPRPTGATVSLSSLVDYPHQARIVETLIVFYRSIFEPGVTPRLHSSASASTSTDSQRLSQYRRIQCVMLCVLLGNSMSSSGSRERSLDSDSELEEAAAQPEEMPKQLLKQESETSTEEDQLSPRASLDLSGHSPPPSASEEPEQEESAPDGDLPSTETTDQEPEPSLAELNTNQSNNTLPSPSGLPAVLLRGGKLTVSRDGGRKPQFV